MPLVYSTPNATDALMRSGQILDYEGLRREAADAAALYEGQQKDLAHELGITPQSLSRALNSAGGHVAGLQRRIIARFTPYQISEEPLFRVERQP